MKKTVLFIVSAVLLLSLAGGLLVFFGIPMRNAKREGNEGLEFVKRMGAGINLGNTLDACGDMKTHDEYRESAYYETSWGNPALKEDVIKTIAREGFGAVRIPVTWAMRTGPAPDYTINIEFLERVKQIVDWVLEADMIAIINMHHDDYYWYIPNKKNSAAVADRYAKMWKQLAEYFKDCGIDLAFEAFNEPRVTGSVTEWAGGTIFTRSEVNKMNGIFVDTVRGTGGLNAERFLILPSYGASIDTNALGALKIPRDSHVIAAVHCYIPRGFATDHDMSATVFTDKDKKAVNKIFKILENKFTSRGIPVIIGEFAAYHKNNDDQREAYAAYMAAKAKAYGIALFWWEEGTNRGHDLADTYGIMDRNTAEFKFPGIAGSLTKPYK